VYKRGTQFGFRFVASNVPDFAFAASNHFNWDATSVVADAKTGRRTFVSAVYKSEDEDYPRVARIAADGIGLMSTWLPGYPFPYPSMTVFSGNDGMEYPMMCNDASTSPDFVTSLTVHEVSHTYFPFLMGINEQEYAWMDEGWASFFDFNLADSLTGGKEGGVRGYGSVAGTESDVPPLVRSSNLRGRAYGVASYQRPQAAYLVLYDLLGYKTFHDCMVGYIDRWQGKHPLPQDFFNTWNNLSGQNLDWFWQPWFAEWGYPDVAVARVERTLGLDSETIVVEKRGNLPIPVHLEITYTDGSKQTVHHTAAVWRSGNTDLRVFTQPNKTVKMVQLGNSKTIPDSDKSNDVWKR
jgi:aminopeptidase N